MTMFRRIDHIGLTPSDFDRSLAFYTEVLGFKAKQRISIDVHPIRDIIYLQLGDTMLELLDVVDPAGPAPEGRRVGYGTMAIEVENMDDALAYLAEKGIRPSVEPRTGAGGTRRAEIKDPDGLSIELRQW
jgi:glyoxylase I family protein